MNKKKPDEKIKKFVEALARTAPTQDFVNQYAYGKRENKIRRDNLIKYLTLYQNKRVDILCIGEAPGYKGSLKTGVPFSSEEILITNKFFTSSKAFKIENRANPSWEMSAKIVWQAMDHLHFYPLIWSAFPFHPHEAKKTESNRRPTSKEIEFGAKFLRELIKIFEIKHFVSVGRIAEKSLCDLGFKSIYIRHPSHGGAELFFSGLKEIKSRRATTDFF